MKHLTIGGSTIARTLACPAWMILSAALPKGKGGFSADLGNLLHDAMEDHLKKDIPFSQMVGKLKFNDQVLEEEHIEKYLVPMNEAVNALLDEHDIDQMLLEPFVQLVEGEQGGSIDVLGISHDTKTAVVADYKTGERWVQPTSPQLRFYALCAMADPATAPLMANVEKVVCAIIQPAQSDKAIQVTYTRAEVEAMQGEIDAALAQPNKIASGSHCSFCPASPVCPEKTAKAKSALLLKPKTAKQLADAVELADEVEAWAKQVRQQAYDIALEGGVIPRHKLVAGRSVRKWKPQADLEMRRVLGDEAFETKLIGVTKAEKLLGKAEFAALDVTELSQNKPALVKEDAPGDAITIKESENLLKLVDKNLNK